MTTTAVPVEPREARGYSAVLRLPGLRWMYLAHSISMAGTVAAEVALSILVYERSHSPLLSALVLVVSFLPWGLGGTVLSALADRFPARRLLVTCDLISATCIAAMLIPRVPVLALLGLLLLTGLVAPLFQGARAASLAYLLPSDLFPAGRSMLRSISQIMVLTGFAAGSVVVAAVGPKWLLGADAASFIASATLLRFGTPRTPAAVHGEPATAGSVVRQSLSGLRDIFGRPQLRRLLVLSWIVPAFASAPDGLAVAYTAQAGSKPTSAGLLFTGYSAGMILSEILVARTAPATKRRLLVPLAMVALVPAIAFVAGPPVLGAAGLLVLVGMGSAYNQGLDPLVLAASEPSIRGRLFTIQSSGLMTVQGIGIAVAGIIGSLVSARYVIAGIGAVGVVTVGIVAVRAVGLRPPRAEPDSSVG
ncbi:MAG TPA: MFS transporter [Mycobacteriales bacterium]|nr:MFS transporter [Mycobacteriales bacterium]